MALGVPILKHIRVKVVGSTTILSLSLTTVTTLSNERLRQNVPTRVSFSNTIPNTLCNLLRATRARLNFQRPFQRSSNLYYTEKSKTKGQTVLIRMRRLIMSRLIWIYTVCKFNCFHFLLIKVTFKVLSSL